MFSWKLWVGAIAGVLVLGSVANALSATEDEPPASIQATEPSASDVAAPSETPDEPEVVVLRITDQKDGDSWIASDGEEYRLGLVNTPERNEPCGTQAAAFTRDFLASGFTTDTYSSDTHGRLVAEVFDADGDPLNVALAESGLGNDRYFEEFRHENPDLAKRLDAAFASAPTPACEKKTTAPVPLVDQPKPTPKNAPQSSCMAGYSPCLPIVADLNCPDIGHPVKVTGGDPYKLDRDKDGIGCD